MLETDYKNLTSCDFDDESQKIFEQLKRDQKDRILQSNYNCQLAVREDPMLKNAFRRNDLSEQIEVIKELGWPRNTTTFSDIDLDNVITYIEDNYCLYKENKVERAVRVIANENHYHPIRDKLNSLVWDGTVRIDDALHHFLGVTKSPLTTEALKIFMLGAINRVFDPGCKFEYMLCLVGGQGAGKSTFLRFLAMNDEWFTDDIKSLDDQKVFTFLHGHWIVEMPEMLAILNAKMVEETKAFISRQKDNFRLAYDKYACNHPRQSVYAGTSNIIQFLPMDKTGNRRFIPIEVNPAEADVHIMANPSESRAYIEQLWAEVMEIYKSGDYTLTLSKEMENMLSKSQEYFSPEDIFEADIRNYIEKERPDYICTKMLYEEALGFSLDNGVERWKSQKISEIMNLKFPEYERISSHRFPKYGTQRAWALKNKDEFRPLSEKDESILPFC